MFTGLLVTGESGYIGTHVVRLLGEKRGEIIVDPSTFMSEKAEEDLIPTLMHS